MQSTICNLKCEVALYQILKAYTKAGKMVRLEVLYRKAEKLEVI